MKLALIADVHANLVPLEAVARDIRRQSVKGVICLGDVLDVGSQPREVLGIVTELRCSFAMGNHDQAIVEPWRISELHIPEHLAPAVRWTAARLTPDQMALIRSFEQTVTFELVGGATLCGFHGSPKRLCELILPTTEEEALTDVFAGISAEILAGGHTHQQMYRRWGARTMVNPGSVGCAWVWDGKSGEPTLMPWAEYAVINISASKAEVELMRIPYDTERAKKLAEASDNPLKKWWQDQYGSISRRK